MEIEGTEIKIKISLTVREAQSLATVLARVNHALICRARIDWSNVSEGMFDDCVNIEKDLRNLVHFDIDIRRR